MVEVQWDGETLRAKGKNRASTMALLGPELLEYKSRSEDELKDELVLPRSEIERVEMKNAGVLSNGRLTLHSRAGRRYKLHFLRKQQEEFESLAELLIA